MGDLTALGAVPKHPEGLPEPDTDTDPKYALMILFDRSSL